MQQLRTTHEISTQVTPVRKEIVEVQTSPVVASPAHTDVHSCLGQASMQAQSIPQQQVTTSRSVHPRSKDVEYHNRPQARLHKLPVEHKHTRGRDALTQPDCLAHNTAAMSILASPRDLYSPIPLPCNQHRTTQMGRNEKSARVFRQLELPDLNDVPPHTSRNVVQHTDTHRQGESSHYKQEHLTSCSGSQQKHSWEADKTLNNSSLRVNRQQRVVSKYKLPQTKKQTIMMNIQEDLLDVQDSELDTTPNAITVSNPAHVQPKIIKCSAGHHGRSKQPQERHLAGENSSRRYNVIHTKDVLVNGFQHASPTVPAQQPYGHMSDSAHVSTVVLQRSRPTSNIKSLIGGSTSHMAKHSKQCLPGRVMSQPARHRSTQNEMPPTQLQAAQKKKHKDREFFSQQQATMKPCHVQALAPIEIEHHHPQEAVTHQPSTLQGAYKRMCPPPRSCLWMLYLHTFRNAWFTLIFCTSTLPEAN